MNEPATQRPEYPTNTFRRVLFSRLYARALTRCIDKQVLHDDICTSFGVTSLKQLTTPELCRCVEQVAGGKLPSPPTRPRGRVRPEGVIALSTPDQKSHIAAMLEQLWSVEVAWKCTQKIMGTDVVWAESTPPKTYADIASTMVTMHTARLLINSLTSTLKRRGMWGKKIG